MFLLVGQPWLTPCLTCGTGGSALVCEQSLLQPIVAEGRASAVAVAARVVRPPFAQVANAVGAAIPQVPLTRLLTYCLT